jgi:hypothetical protein
MVMSISLPGNGNAENIDPDDGGQLRSLLRRSLRTTSPRWLKK